MTLHKVSQIQEKKLKYWLFYSKVLDAEMQCLVKLFFFQIWKEYNHCVLHYGFGLIRILI